LQFAKASAATLSQQEKNARQMRRWTFGEFESLAVALRRALHH
jgi:hypothetical protein